MTFQAGNGAKKVLVSWMSATGIAAAGLCGLLAGLLSDWLFIGAGAVSLLTVFGVLWYPPHYIRRMQGSFDGHAIRAVKGVFWRKELFIPMNALRTFECWSSPVQTLFGCRTLILRFAGGAALLPLLSAEQAKALTLLLEKAENEYR